MKAGKKTATLSDGGEKRTKNGFLSFEKVGSEYGKLHKKGVMSGRG